MSFENHSRYRTKQNNNPELTQFRLSMESQLQQLVQRNIIHPIAMDYALGMTPKIFHHFKSFPVMCSNSTIMDETLVNIISAYIRNDMDTSP